MSMYPGFKRIPLRSALERQEHFDKARQRAAEAQERCAKRTKEREQQLDEEFATHDAELARPANNRRNRRKRKRK